jgi:hypothetical protein
MSGGVEEARYNHPTPELSSFGSREESPFTHCKLIHQKWTVTSLNGPDNTLRTGPAGVLCCRNVCLWSLNVPKGDSISALSQAGIETLFSNPKLSRSRTENV